MEKIEEKGIGVKGLLCGILLASCFFLRPLQAESIVTQDLSLNTLALENEFLKIIVNNDPENMGRFAIETTEGDPGNPNDNQQPLVYGRPAPWTSYSTIYLDGKPIIFGGKNNKNEKRSGIKLDFSDEVTQRKEEKRLVSIAKIGNLDVEQSLQFIINPSTKVKDLVLISYHLINRDQKAHEVGVRLMLDTKLGNNDGAPFRMSNQTVDSEIMMGGKDLVEYWQSFDSLSSPNVIAQGYFSMDSIGLTPPDRVYLANWGTLFDHPFDFLYTKDRSFQRLGEDEMDTAMALYWSPRRIEPGESLLIQSAYGLGGVSLSPGMLSLGLTSPTEIPWRSPKEILIVAYVSNSGGYDALNAEVIFDLPPHFKVIQGQKRLHIGILKAGQTRQIPLKVKVGRETKPGLWSLQLKVTSSTFEPNTIKRPIHVLAPPALIGKIFISKEKILDFNRYFSADISVHNPSNHRLDSILVDLHTQSPIRVSALELQSKKKIPFLNPGESATLNWVLSIDAASPSISNTLINAKITSSATLPLSISHSLLLKPNNEFIKTRLSKASLLAGDYFHIIIEALNHAQSDLPAFSVSWNPEHTLYKRHGVEVPFQSYLSSEKFGNTIRFISRSLPSASILVLAKIHFQMLHPGVGVLQFRIGDQIHEMPLHHLSLDSKEASLLFPLQ